MALNESMFFRRKYSAVAVAVMAVLIGDLWFLIENCALLPTVIARSGARISRSIEHICGIPLAEYFNSCATTKQSQPMGLLLPLKRDRNDTWNNYSEAAADSLPRFGPSLLLSVQQYDMGLIQAGEIIDVAIRLKNVGTDTLRIYDVKTTCGCTMAIVEKGSIPPDDSTHLKIVFNSTTRMGQQDGTITIISNDARYAAAMVHLSGNVVPISEGLTTVGAATKTIHGGRLRSPRYRSEIFSRGCAVCHAYDGFGKRGEELFQADCAMCHAGVENHKPADVLTKANILHLSDDSLRTIIAFGKLNSTMPAFSKERGGPLTSEDIESLMQYLRRKE
jgi:hypothetical protein